MPSQTYSIGDLASEFGITTRTIRFYEEKGLLKPVRLGNRRRYAPADRVRLKLILRGKRIGLNLDECQEIIDMYRPEEQNRSQLSKLLETVARRRAQLLAQRQDIEDTLLALDEIEARCRDSLGQCESPAPGNPPHKEAL